MSSSSSIRHCWRSVTYCSWVYVLFFLIFSQFILTHHNLAFVVCMVTYVFVLLCLLCLICSRTLSLSHTHTHTFFSINSSMSPTSSLVTHLLTHTTLTHVNQLEIHHMYKHIYVSRALPLFTHLLRQTTLASFHTNRHSVICTRTHLPTHTLVPLHIQAQFNATHTHTHTHTH